MEYIQCDYEKDCSRLYKAIENAIVDKEQDYDHIAYFLETGVWPDDSAGSVAGPTAEIQAKTWVTRFCPDEKRKVEWSVLPIHLAIVGGAPLKIIVALVKLYPQGLRCANSQRMLPLHLALRHGAKDEIVAFLVAQFPEAVNIKGKNGRTPVDCALRARDKARGIILTTFVEETKSKLQDQIIKETSVDVSATIDDKTKVKAELSSKSEALKQMLNDHSLVSVELGSLKELKTKMEEELSSQMQEHTKEKAKLEASSKQKIEKLTIEKLTETIKLNKKIDALVAEKRAAEEALHKAKEEATSMRKELETVQKSVANSVSIEEEVSNQIQEITKEKAELEPSSTQKIETPAPSSPKKVKGQSLMKLNAVRFRRTAPAKIETAVKSIEERAVSGTVDDSKDGFPSSFRQGDMSPAVRKVQSMEKDAIERQAKIDDASANALPPFSPAKRASLTKTLLPFVMRKVRSMDPRTTRATVDHNEVVRTWSDKRVISERGEAELEQRDEMRSDSEQGKRPPRHPSTGSRIRQQQQAAVTNELIQQGESSSHGAAHCQVISGAPETSVPTEAEQVPELDERETFSWSDDSSQNPVDDVVCELLDELYAGLYCTPRYD